MKVGLFAVVSGRVGGMAVMKPIEEMLAWLANSRTICGVQVEIAV